MLVRRVGNQFALRLKVGNYILNYPFQHLCARAFALLTVILPQRQRGLSERGAPAPDRGPPCCFAFFIVPTLRWI